MTITTKIGIDEPSFLQKKLQAGFFMAILWLFKVYRFKKIMPRING